MTYLYRSVVGVRAVFLNADLDPSEKHKPIDDEDILLSYMIIGNEIRFRLFPVTKNTNTESIMKLCSHYNPSNIAQCVEFKVNVNTFNFNFFFKHGLLNNNDHPLAYF